MSSQSIALKPQDVAVMLELAVKPEAPYGQIAADLAMSSSTAHESVVRLQIAGLLRPESRQVNRHALFEFLEHGVRYAFPAKLGPRIRGVPTAFSAQPLAREIIAEDVVVWPDPQGIAIGHSIAPLVERASQLYANRPEVYWLLTLVDAIRIGRARERTRAIALLKERLAPAA